MDIINKLERCVTFGDVITLSEELHENGISVQRTNSNKIVLCIIDSDGRYSCKKLFEDFVPLTVCNNENSLLPAKTLTNVVEFVKKNLSENSVKRSGITFDVSALYGSNNRVLAIDRDVEKLIIRELKSALKVSDEIDAVSRGCDD